MRSRSRIRSGYGSFGSGGGGGSDGGDTGRFGGFTGTLGGFTGRSGTVTLGTLTGSAGGVTGSAVVTELTTWVAVSVTVCTGDVPDEFSPDGAPALAGAERA